MYISDSKSGIGMVNDEGHRKILYTTGFTAGFNPIDQLLPGKEDQQDAS